VLPRPLADTGKQWPDAQSISPGLPSPLINGALVSKLALADRSLLEV